MAGEWIIAFSKSIHWELLVHMGLEMLIHKDTFFVADLWLGYLVCRLDNKRKVSWDYFNPSFILKFVIHFLYM